ncbi:BTB/POZ domain-containing protein isoform 1 [Schistosoma japonicum]|uniref:BTB/POZ domain-containing protein isoform 1 n=2 Tax=Schistosoma japonicum TaxID=6182 RepID=A0A4Z2CSM6_SCHJA|nr:NICE-3 protein [Schistosoma japonicum]KAH8870004.1 NICE-3 protein [Schistosoma japonicum]TNN07148.1 BTB/POZ domain-containing protein isoform 1 [Schistosoma japonicum]
MPTQHIALALFLVLLAIGSIMLISILIIVKRRIARRKSRVGRTTYNPCGHGLPKVWKSNIEKKINATIKIRTEPQVFGPHYAENYDAYISNGELTFLHRAKAVDQFLTLKQAILSIDPTLEAPPLRDIRDFLLTARHHIMNPPPPRDYIEEYCQLYLWARHDLNPFGQAEYTRFCELQTTLLETINRSGSWPVYSSTASNLIGQLSSEQPLKAHKRTHSNFKVSFPSFLFKSTEHSQPRIAHPIGLVTTTVATTFGSSSQQTETSTSMSTGLYTATSSSLPSITVVQQSRPTRVKVLSKTGQTGGLNLKRLSHSTYRKKHELLVSPSEHDTLAMTSRLPSSSHVFTNDIIGENDSSVDLTLLNKIDRIDAKASGVTCSHRRDSCQSDGSQTALIDLEPIIVVNQSKSPIQTSRQIKLNESYIMQPDTKNSIRFNKGMENEGVNC